VNIGDVERVHDAEPLPVRRHWLVPESVLLRDVDAERLESFFQPPQLSV